MDIEFLNETELDAESDTLSHDEQREHDFEDRFETASSDDQPEPHEFRGESQDDGSSPVRGGAENETKVALDWVELEAALENNSPELHSFLNAVTGDVIRIFEGTENAEVRLEQAENSPDYIYIDPISSREQYRWMEEFIEVVEDPTLKDKLNIAIDGKGAFRRFKDVLMAYPAEREQWFGKRSAKLRGYMQEWLMTKNVTATNSPPWEGGEDERRPRPDMDSRVRREGNADLRNAAHEALDLVPSRELPTAVAFLEFLRNRRAPRRSSRLG